MANKDPLMVTVLEQSAKANATRYDTGRACDDKIRCHYYPRSNTWGWWNQFGKCSKIDVVEHYRFLETFNKQPA